MLITLTEIKAQCRIEHSAEDTLLTSYGEAASAAAADHLNRPLYVDQAALDADDSAPLHALVVNDKIKIGILMVVGQLYAHREASDNNAAKHMDRTVQMLWNQVWFDEV